MPSRAPSASIAPADDRCDEPHGDPDRLAPRRAALLPPATLAPLAEMFKVLGDVTRVRLLDALSHGELCVCDLATLVGLSESAVSHQLRLLRGMRLVRPRRAGRQVFYALDDQHIMSVFQHGLGHVQEDRWTTAGRGPHGPGL